MSAAKPVAARVQALEAAFRHIAETRMAGVPVLHVGLRVEAVDFAEHRELDGHAETAAGALGVLLTPWFMNLVWLPMARQDHAGAVGVARSRTVGGERFDFIGAHEPAVGSFEACSLFSPMFQFADHGTACATARAVLASLRSVSPASADPAPARRSFLFGRSAVAGSAP